MLWKCIFALTVTLHFGKFPSSDNKLWELIFALAFNLCFGKSSGLDSKLFLWQHCFKSAFLLSCSIIDGNLLFIDDYCKVIEEKVAEIDKDQEFGWDGKYPPPSVNVSDSWHISRLIFQAWQLVNLITIEWSWKYNQYVTWISFAGRLQDTPVRYSTIRSYQICILSHAFLIFITFQ